MLRSRPTSLSSGPCHVQCWRHQRSGERHRCGEACLHERGGRHPPVPPADPAAAWRASSPPQIPPELRFRCYRETTALGPIRHARVCARAAANATAWWPKQSSGATAPGRSLRAATSRASGCRRRYCFCIEAALCARPGRASQTTRQRKYPGTFGGSKGALEPGRAEPPGALSLRRLIQPAR